MTEKKTNWQEKMGKKPVGEQKNAENEQNLAQNAENRQENVENGQENEQKLTNEEILAQELQKERQKSAELNNKLLRALAEIENVRRRAKVDLEKSNSYAISSFVSELVVVAENFFLACDNLPKDAMEKDNEVKNFVMGVDMTKKELMKILEKNKVKRVYPMGEQFNHDLHEAVSKVESDEEEGVVVQVVQAGYVIGDRLIRPALVGVAA